MRIRNLRKNRSVQKLPKLFFSDSLENEGNFSLTSFSSLNRRNRKDKFELPKIAIITKSVPFKILLNRVNWLVMTFIMISYSGFYWFD